MIRVEVEVEGLRALLPDIPELRQVLTATEIKRVWLYKQKRWTQPRPVDVKIYRHHGRGKNKRIEVGLGAVLWLARNSGRFHFVFKSYNPKDRQLLKMKPEPLPRMKSSPKWLVNGKERWYYFEALEACFKNIVGSVKLPTGSGKTEIELTLAEYQRQWIGSGLIVVPTKTIHSQFMTRADRYDLPIYEYRDLLTRWKKGEFDKDVHMTCVTTPKVLVNDTNYEDAREFLSSMKWLISDETHHSTSATWYDLHMRLPSLTRSHGFSALPLDGKTEGVDRFDLMSLNDARMISIVGPVIYEKSAKDLEDFLNIPVLINIDIKWDEVEYDARLRNSTEWREVYEASIKNKFRNIVISKIIDYMIERGYRSMMHVAEKAHAHHVMMHIKNKRQAVTWFSGAAMNGVGEKISIDDVREGYGDDYLHMFATSHAIEGLDMDAPVNCLITTDGRAPRVTVQKGGRVTRPGDRPSVVINIRDQNVKLLKSQSYDRAGRLKDEFDCEIYSASSIDELGKILDVLEEKFNGGI